MVMSHEEHGDVDGRKDPPHVGGIPVVRELEDHVRRAPGSHVAGVAIGIDLRELVAGGALIGDEPASKSDGSPLRESAAFGCGALGRVAQG